MSNTYINQSTTKAHSLQEKSQNILHRTLPIPPQVPRGHPDRSPDLSG